MFKEENVQKRNIHGVSFDALVGTRTTCRCSKIIKAVRLNDSTDQQQSSFSSHLFQVSTFNWRTINPVSRKQELANSSFMHHYDIIIICIQEHNITKEPYESKIFIPTNLPQPLPLKIPRMFLCWIPYLP